MRAVPLNIYIVLNYTVHLLLKQQFLTDSRTLFGFPMEQEPILARSGDGSIENHTQLMAVCAINAA